MPAGSGFARGVKTLVTPPTPQPTLGYFFNQSFRGRIYHMADLPSLLFWVAVMIMQVARRQIAFAANPAAAFFSVPYYPAIDRS